MVSRNCASVNCIYFYPVLVENNELRSVIESGGADIAVDNDRYVPEYDGYVQEFLYHQKLYVCIMPDHPLADRDIVTFSELGRYPIIARSNPVGFNSWIREIKKLNRTDLQENANMSFNAWLHEGYRLRFHFLINNFGISTVWDNVKDLVTIPVSGKYTERDIYLYYQENENEGVRELLDIIKENAASTTKADRALGF